MFSKLKHIKELKSQASQMQKMLAEEKIETYSSSSKIKITMNGNQEVIELDIDSELLAPEKRDELQNELKQTFNKSIKEIQKVMAEKIRQSGNFNLHGI